MATTGDVLEALQYAARETLGRSVVIYPGRRGGFLLDGRIAITVAQLDNASRSKELFKKLALDVIGQLNAQKPWFDATKLQWFWADAPF